MVAEIGIVIALIVINGLLAMSELAIVSARPARLKARGGRGARTALALAEDPGRFLSTVQIGITLVGVLSGAFSGATLGTRLGDALLTAGVPAGIAEPAGVGIVVVAITYLSLIVGELVPKQIALAAPEAVSARVATPMKLMSRIALPLVFVLDRSGKLVLSLIGQSGQRETGVTEEEVRLVIAEAAGAGIIEEDENALIEGVMRIADRNARALMTPRLEVDVVGIDESCAEVVARFKKSGHSRLLVRDGGADDIVGMIASRDFLDSRPEGFALRRQLREVPVIIDTLPAMAVIARLRETPAHLLLVYDEYGHFEGIITATDVLGAIAGGFDFDSEHEPPLVEREDGSLLVSGSMPVGEFADRLGIKLPDDMRYETVAGLVLEVAGELPRVGQHVTVGGWRIEVIDLDGRRIDKLLVTAALPATTTARSLAG